MPKKTLKEAKKEGVLAINQPYAYDYGYIAFNSQFGYYFEDKRTNRSLYLLNKNGDLDKI